MENDVSDVETRKNEIINKAKNEARNILISAKEEANDIIKELNDLYDSADKDSLKKANKLRDNLNEDIKNNLSGNTTSENSESTNKIEVSIGLEVLVKPFNMVGTILTMPNKNDEVIVQFGSTKTNVKVSNLQYSKKANTLNNSKKFHTTSNTFKTSTELKSKSVSPEINVIGQNVEDAIFIIDKYLDDCYLAHLSTARIVHGKGTGKLRKGIHAFLKNHPHVHSFRLGTFGEGEMGVTIVELKKQ